MKFIYVTKNVNLNVVINFLLFVMHWQVSGGKHNPTVILKLAHIVIFFNELVKEIRRQKEKSQGYSLQIP